MERDCLAGNPDWVLARAKTLSASFARVRFRNCPNVVLRRPAEIGPMKHAGGAEYDAQVGNMINIRGGSR